MRLATAARACAASVGISLLFACSATVEATVSPDAQLDRDQTFYVQHNPKDTDNFHLFILDELAQWDRRVTAGSEDGQPEDVDLLVTYENQWYWDMTPYLLSFDIFIRDPQTQLLIASGRSVRTSLARASAKTMIAEILTEIFADANPDEVPPEGN